MSNPLPKLFATYSPQFPTSKGFTTLDTFRREFESCEEFAGVIGEINKLMVLKDLASLKRSRARELAAFKKRYAAFLDLPEVAAFLAKVEIEEEQSEETE